MDNSRTFDNDKALFKQKQYQAGGILLLIAISVLLFSGIWQKDFIGKDEEVFNNIPKYIGENLTFYQTQPHTPFSALTFILTQKFSLPPFYHYFFNWLIHTLNTVLLFYLLTCFSKKLSQQLLAFFLCYLFLIHPLNLYSTAFLINRGGLLAGLFTSLLLILACMKYEKSSISLLTIIGLFVLLFLATFSHFISIVLIIPILYIVYSFSKEENKFSSRVLFLYGSLLLSVLISLFVFLTIYQSYAQKDLYTTLPPFNYIDTISSLYIFTFFPISYFPLRSLEITSILSVPIAIIIILFLLAMVVYFYRSGKKFLLLSSLLLLISTLYFPVFQRLDINMCNGGYFILLNTIVLIFFISKYIYDTNAKVGSIISIFWCIIALILSLFSFQLIRELKDPEQLWLSCTGNHLSNKEAWEFLARSLTKKAKVEKDIHQKEILFDKAEQAWDTLLQLYPENTEALREKSLIYLDLERNEDAKSCIARAIGLDPFNPLYLRTQIVIIEKEIETAGESKEKLQQLYNAYMNLYYINKNLQENEQIEFLKVAQKLSNKEEAYAILKENLEQLSKREDTRQMVESLYKENDELQKIMKNIPSPILNNGDTFQPPYLQLADYYQYKDLLTLTLAWLNFSFQKNQNDQETLLKIGVIYGNLGKPKDFIEKWGTYLQNNDSLWEKLVQKCIDENNFEVAQNYMEQTLYSASKKYMLLANYAIEKGNQEQAKLWIEKARNSEPNSEEAEEINKLINKIQ